MYFTELLPKHHIKLINQLSPCHGLWVPNQLKYDYSYNNFNVILRIFGLDKNKYYLVRFIFARTFFDKVSGYFFVD
jgi:hypothetical protein